MQVQLLPGALKTWPVRLSEGHQPLKLEGRVRFPHGSLTAKWCNWKTRDAQNVGPRGRGSSNFPLATFDDLTQVSQCSAEPHKLSPPGATPGPATCGRVRKLWQSGGARSLVTLWVRRPPRLLDDGSRGPTATTPGRRPGKGGSTPSGITGWVCRCFGSTPPW